MERMSNKVEEDEVGDDGWKDQPAGTMVVDVANSRVGGGCFHLSAFVQEEQMTAQTTDMQQRLMGGRPVIGLNQESVFHQGRAGTLRR
jgi:hypothetical protein